MASRTARTARGASRGRQRCDGCGPKVAGVRVPRGGPLSAWVLVEDRRDGLVRHVVERRWEPLHHAGQLEDHPDGAQVVVTWGDDPPTLEQYPPSLESTEWFSAFEDARTSRGRPGRERARQVVENPDLAPLAFVSHAWSRPPDRPVKVPDWCSYQLFATAGRYAWETTAGPGAGHLEQMRTALDPGFYQRVGASAARVLSPLGHYHDEYYEGRDALQALGLEVGTHLPGSPPSPNGRPLVRAAESSMPREYARHRDAVEALADVLGVVVMHPGERYEERGRDAIGCADGYAVRGLKTVALADRSDWDASVGTKTLTHEFAHLLDIAPYTGDPVSYALGEVVAESTAAIVLSTLSGTPVPDSSRAYVAVFASQLPEFDRVPDELRAQVLEHVDLRARGVAGLMLAALDGDRVAGAFARSLVEHNSFPENG